MGIVPDTGSKFLTEDQKTPEELTQVDVTTSFDERLLKRTYVADTFNTRTALSISRMDPVVETLGKLASGSPIKVTYFSQILNYTNKRSNPSDYSFHLNNVNKAYSKILDMEIRLNEALSFNFSPDTNESMVEGSGKILPGFTVNAGDVWLYEVTPGNLGVFVVGDVTPLSLHRGAFQEITFFLKEWATAEIVEKFDQCTYDTYYYATQNILGETRCLLKKEDYFNLVSILKLRSDLIEFYEDTFYSPDNNTIFRPDEVYDPYIIQFLNGIVSFSETKYYPYTQLIDKTIWDKESILTELLEDKIRFKNTTIKKFITETYVKGALSAYINGMLRREYVDLDPLGSTNYLLLSDTFYTTDPLTDPFENILRNYMKTKVVDVSAIIAYTADMSTVPILNIFYQIPVLIFLCNKVIISLGE